MTSTKIDHEAPQELERIASLLRLAGTGRAALDVGARDGVIAIPLTETYDSVTAVDLNAPELDHPKVRTRQGNIASLPFSDGEFDLVVCAEVLEHLPPELVTKACSELVRVSRDRILIGVPYKQDIRLGRLTCSACGRINPPWGHLNSFDEVKLAKLFAGTSQIASDHIGSTNLATNALSAALADFAGNPFGTYGQKEPCMYCGATMAQARAISLLQRVVNKFASVINDVQQHFSTPHANWIHLVYRKIG